MQPIQPLMTRQLGHSYPGWTESMSNVARFLGFRRSPDRDNNAQVIDGLWL